MKTVPDLIKKHRRVPNENYTYLYAVAYFTYCKFPEL